MDKEITLEAGTANAHNWDVKKFMLCGFLERFTAIVPMATFIVYDEYGFCM